VQLLCCILSSATSTLRLPCHATRSISRRVGSPLPPNLNRGIIARVSRVAFGLRVLLEEEEARRLLSATKREAKLKLLD